MLFYPADGLIDVAIEAGDVRAAILTFVSLWESSGVAAKLNWMGRHVRSEKGGENVANHASYSVDGKDVEGVVDAGQELQLCGKIAECTAADSNHDSGPGGNKAGRRRDGHETGDGAGAEPNGAPFLLKSVVEQDPGDAGARRSQIGHVAGHDGTEIHRQRGAAVEPEPSHPEEDGAENNVGHAVRAVGETLGLGVAGSLAEHETVREGAAAGGDVDGAAAGKVDSTELVKPAIGVPCPVGNRVVDNRRPDEDEDDGGQHAPTVSDGSDGQSWAA